MAQPGALLVRQARLPLLLLVLDLVKIVWVYQIVGLAVDGCSWTFKGVP